MISWLDPRLWLTLIVVSVIGFTAGVYQSNKNWQSKENRVALENEKALTKIKDEKKLESDALRETINLMAAADKLKEEAHEKTINRLRRDITAGSFRLSIPVASCPTNTLGGSTGSPDDSPRAELLPETSIDLVNLAAAADEEVRRTNRCIKSYNEVRAKVNAQNLPKSNDEN